MSRRNVITNLTKMAETVRIRASADSRMNWTEVWEEEETMSVGMTSTLERYQLLSVMHTVHWRLTF